MNLRDMLDTMVDVENKSRMSPSNCNCFRTIIDHYLHHFCLVLNGNLTAKRKAYELLDRLLLVLFLQVHHSVEYIADIYFILKKQGGNDGYNSQKGSRTT